MKSNNAIIESTYDALHDYLTKTSENAEVYKQLEKDYYPGYKAYKVLPFNEAKLFDCMMELRESITQEAAKSSGRGDLRKAMMFVLKNADGRHECLRKAYFDESCGSTVVCDSFQLIRTPGRVEGLPYNGKDDREYIDYKRILPRTDTYMKLPTLGELKAWMKLNKGVTHYTLNALDGSDFHVNLDPKYLKNLLEAVGEDGICKATYSKPFSPVTIESNDGTVYCLLDPVLVFK